MRYHEDGLTYFRGSIDNLVQWLKETIEHKKVLFVFPNLTPLTDTEFCFYTHIEMNPNVVRHGVREITYVKCVSQEALIAMGKEMEEKGYQLTCMMSYMEDGKRVYTSMAFMY